MGSSNDLLELSRHLKQERLFIVAEKTHLRNLNEEVAKTAEHLYHFSWITREQQDNLKQLILADKNSTLESCCQRDNALELINFVDGYRNLSYHEAKVGEFMKSLRNNPKLIASILMFAEKQGFSTLQQTAKLLISGLFGNTVIQDDETLVFQILRHLIEMQVACNENPRMMLRKGSCSFSVVFKLLNDGLFAAKLYLTAALHQPVMQLLMEDEWFYDVDPERALYRFPPNERTRRFGEPGTPEYKEKTKHYRELTAGKLVMLTERFISSIKNNMYCFPASLGWLVSQLYHSVTKAGLISAMEARCMCADLLFVSFIGPAICDPESCGITSDAPISYIARHNLMQVAQILQVLAISTWEEIDPKTRDLYGKFAKGCMSFLLDSLLDGPCYDQPPAVHPQATGYQRSAVLFTMPDLLQLVSFARSMMEGLSEDSGERKALENYLENVPLEGTLQTLRERSTPDTTPQPTPPGTPSTGKKLPKGKDKKRLLLSPDPPGGDGNSQDQAQNAMPQEVMVISLGVVNECPGMLSENKVLEQDSKQKKLKSNSLLPGEDDPIRESEIHLHEKRTRFSLSHDQDSIATSDCLEAISEAASSHSVGSDLENDNLSDMVSANVSGRGTPNISGRDTPVSQAESQEAESQAESVEERRAPDLPVLVQKTNREDVTERFGKFEIKPDFDNMLCEAKSTVSDTWSTDVLASDSEPPDSTQRERLEEVAVEEMARHNLLGFNMGIPLQEVSEVSETASDLWSTDVLASDTSERQAERLAELEQDEVGSISSRSQGQEDQEVNEPTDSAEGAAAGAGPDVLAPSKDVGTAADLVLLSSASGTRLEDDFPDSERDEAGSEFSGFQEAGSELGTLDAGSEFSAGPDPDQPNVAEIVEAFDTMETSKHNYEPGNRASESFKYAKGKVASVLESFDPLSPPPRPQKSVSSEGFNDGLYVQSGSNSLGGSAVTLVAENMLQSPDHGMASGSISTVQSPSMTASSSGDTFGRQEQDSGIVPTPVDSLASDLSDSLKLTDQQNVNIANQRLSATVDFFDPLLEESSSDPLPLDRGQSLSEPLPQFPPPPPQTLLQRLSYGEQGARPKIPAVDSSAPKIALKLNSVDFEPDAVQDLLGSEDGRHLRHPASNGPVAQPHKDHGARESQGGGADRASSSSGSSEGNREDESQSKTSARPDSSGSGDHLSQSIEETVTRESADTLEKSPEKKKSGSAGFFRSFKERLSKDTSLFFLPTQGPFTVPTISMRGGKRKPTKAEKEESNKAATSSASAASGPIDIDRNSTGDNVSIKSGSAPNPDTTDEILNKYKPVNLNRSQSEHHSQDTTEDILAKYRKQGSSQKPTPGGSADSAGASAKDRASLREQEEEEEGPPAYDPTNLENCKAFLDAKKKLRLVLSTADFQALPWVSGHHVSGLGRLGNNRKENDVVAFLKLQLAEAINLQDRDLVAQLHETIRCLRQFDNHEMRKLLKTMREEYRSRAPYISYLVRCRQGLLTTQAHLDRLLHRVQRDKLVCNKHFVSVYVRLFLEKKERALMRFISEFQKLTVSDEKTDLVERFLEYLHQHMEQDPAWLVASDSQVTEARLYIERNVMSHIYTHAMYPNGDGDIMRDQILHEHMRKLSQVITARHRDLRIPKMYHYECPWPAAQAEIYMINAYKTPKDKLQCVLRCSSTIMNLLSMANEKSVPAADDFTPVLIYVLLKANPPSLLSTIQYINSFYEKRLNGEEQYWWMQFVAAIEFIKTMDYSD